MKVNWFFTTTKILFFSLKKNFKFRFENQKNSNVFSLNLLRLVGSTSAFSSKFHEEITVSMMCVCLLIPKNGVVYWQKQLCSVLLSIYTQFYTAPACICATPAYNWMLLIDYLYVCRCLCKSVSLSLVMLYHHHHHHRITYKYFHLLTNAE